MPTMGDDVLHQTDKGALLRAVYEALSVCLVQQYRISEAPNANAANELLGI